MRNEETPTIIICERNRFLADSLCNSFGTHGAFKSQAHGRNDASLMQLVTQVRACAVLINPDFLPAMPEDFVKSLARAHAGCRGIAYFSPEVRSSASACIRAGFGGAVSQSLSIHDLVEALRTVCLGSIYVDSGLVISEGADEHGRCLDSLSMREQFVLEHVARGHSHKEIARLLALSTKTVETYKLRGTRKLGLSRKSSIVDYALRNDWLS